jgi:hypothetical protein
MQAQALPGRDSLTPRDTLWLQVVGRISPGGFLHNMKSCGTSLALCKRPP